MGRLWRCASESYYRTPRHASGATRHALARVGQILASVFAVLEGTKEHSRAAGSQAETDAAYSHKGEYVAEASTADCHRTEDSVAISTAGGEMLAPAADYGADGSTEQEQQQQQQNEQQQQQQHEQQPEDEESCALQGPSASADLD